LQKLAARRCEAFEALLFTFNLIHNFFTLVNGWRATVIYGAEKYMNSSKVHPTTAHGIKQLAKTIKRELNITHSTALDQAAIRAGYQNYSHANTALKTVRPNVLQYGVHISCGWKDRATMETGREVYRLSITKKFAEILRLRDLPLSGTLQWCEVNAPDNLTYTHLASTREIARRHVNEAVRIIQFLDATKLRPSRSYSKAYPKGKSSNAIPGQDHAQIWFDPATKGYLITDEPYDDHARSKLEEREHWAQKHNFNLAKTEWGGMHNPGGGTSMYLIGANSRKTTFDLALAAINEMSKPIQDAQWFGKSGPSSPMFFHDAEPHDASAKVKTFG
jgi:hypothetical protein